MERIVEASPETINELNHLKPGDQFKVPKQVAVPIMQYLMANKYMFTVEDVEGEVASSRLFTIDYNPLLKKGSKDGIQLWTMDEGRENSARDESGRIG